MKKSNKTKILILGSLLLAIVQVISKQGIVLAQPGVSPYYKGEESFAGKTVVIPAGTTFEGRIESTIGSTVSKQGERFTISLSSPVLANGSDVLIPAGAQVIGEVVQAIPAKSVPHAKHEKPVGKLRIQVTALKMPDGSTYPMVASIVGEESVNISPYPGGFRGFAQYNNKSAPLGSGVAYIGTQPGFRSVAPRAQYRNPGMGMGMSRSPVVTKNELLNDPILGRENGVDNQDKMSIRSLVKKNRNLYIYSGSPLTVRLEAPFKLGLGSSSAEASSLGLDIKRPQNNAIQSAPQAVPQSTPQAAPVNKSAPVINNRINPEGSNF